MGPRHLGNKSRGGVNSLTDMGVRRLSAAGVGLAARKSKRVAFLYHIHNSGVCQIY